MRLADLYHDAIANKVFPSEKRFQCLWNEWVWQSDCNASIDESCGDMNQMHIIGIFLALMESMMTQCDDCIEDLLPDIPLVHLHKKPISAYSLRELTDQVECLQLSWGQVLSHGDFETYYKVLKELFSRFGYIIHHAYPIAVDDTVLDDPQYITQIPSDEKLYITTRKYIRQMCAMTLMIHRTLYIISSAEIVPVISDENGVLIKAAFKPHHIESSSDFFNHLQQMICLAPGMRLVYRTNFAGMYNDISQVVYFHHPKFAKQPQLKIQEILQSSINTLPLMTQLFPQIQVFYDDDSSLPFLSDTHTTHSKVIDDVSMMDINAFAQQKIDENNRKKKGTASLEQEDVLIAKTREKDINRYSWLVCCSSVFLMDSKTKKIFASYDNSLLPLISKMIFDDETSVMKDCLDGQDPESLLKGVKIDLGTAYGHVSLM